MKKRNVGERAEILFDSIDLQILEKLLTAQNVNNQPEGYGILELANALDIKHKNLKPHIDKLKNLNLIFAYKNNDKLYLWTGIANMKYIFENDYSLITDDIEKQEEMRKETEQEQNLIEYLRKVRSLNYKNNMTKAIEMDFRKLKSTLPSKIDYQKENNRLEKNEKMFKKMSREMKPHKGKKI